MRKIGIYARVSTEEQARVEEGSIKNQIESLKRFIEAENLKVNNEWGKIIKIYKDEGYSAKNLKRPGVQQLIIDIKKEKVDTILFTEYSRLTRRMKDFVELTEFFQEIGAEVIASRQPIDTSNVAGRTALNLMMVVHQAEREQTAERVKESRNERTRRGLWAGGPAVVFGLKRTEQKGHLTIDEVEAAHATKIVDILIEEAGAISSTLRILKERGIYRRNGKPWDKNSIARWIKNIALIGKVEVNPSNKEKNQDKLRRSEKYEVVKAVWEPVVPEGKWKKANRLLEENFRKLKVERWKYHDYLFTGLIKCPNGARLVGSSGKGRSGAKYSHYKHSANIKCACHIKTIPVEKVEKPILKEIKRLISKEKVLESLVERANSDFKSTRPSIEAVGLNLKRKQENIEKKLDRITDQILSGEDGLQDIWKEKLIKLQQEKKRVEKDILNHDESSQQVDQVMLDAVKIREVLNKLFANFDQLSKTQKLGLIRSIVEEVEIQKDQYVVKVKNPGFDIGLKDENPDLKACDNGDRDFAYYFKWRERRDSNPRPPA